MGLSGSRSTSTSISLPGLASPRATEPNTAAWDAPSRFNSLSWVRKVRRTSLSTPVIFQPCGKAHRKSASEKRVGKARQPELRNFIGAVLIADKAAREIASVQADQFPQTPRFPQTSFPDQFPRPVSPGQFPPVQADQFPRTSFPLGSIFHPPGQATCSSRGAALARPAARRESTPFQKLKRGKWIFSL